MGDVHTHKIIKRSRKEHVCYQCGIVIPKGISYSFSSGIFEDEPYTQKNHIECYHLYIDFNKDSGPYEWFDITDTDEFEQHRIKMENKYQPK